MSGARFHTATECEFLRNPVREPDQSENSRFGTAICAGPTAIAPDEPEAICLSH